MGTSSVCNGERTIVHFLRRLRGDPFHHAGQKSRSCMGISIVHNTRGTNATCLLPDNQYTRQRYMATGFYNLETSKSCS